MASLLLVMTMRMNNHIAIFKPSQTAAIQPSSL
jgi:hypothetical protein